MRMGDRCTMTIRWYQLGVLVLWLAATGWLVVCKIVPPLLIGEPPVYASMAADKPQPPVAWFLDLNHSRLGWALSEISRQSTDVTEIHSLVHFDGLPLDQLLPAYLQIFVPQGSATLKGVQLEVESHMLINPLNQLQSFDSRLKFHPHSGQSLVAIEGTVDGDKLKLSFRAGDTPPGKWEISMPENKIRDSFSPETELRRLHRGQSWTIVTYSPLALPSNPLDLLSTRRRPRFCLPGRRANGHHVEGAHGAGVAGSIPQRRGPNPTTIRTSATGYGSVWMAPSFEKRCSSAATACCSVACRNKRPPSCATSGRNFSVNRYDQVRSAADFPICRKNVGQISNLPKAGWKPAPRRNRVVVSHYD